MALVKGINSYATVLEADTYFADRIDVAAWTGGSSDQKGQALVLGHLSELHLIEYRNDFGIEYEVNGHNYSTKNKSQNLALETKGTLSAGIPTKFSCDENIWSVATASDPSMDFDLEESAPTLDGMLEMIKSKILERGEYGIRGLG